MSFGLGRANALGHRIACAGARRSPRVARDVVRSAKAGAGSGRSALRNNPDGLGMEAAGPLALQIGWPKLFTYSLCPSLDSRFPILPVAAPGRYAHIHIVKPQGRDRQSRFAESHPDPNPGCPRSERTGPPPLVAQNGQGRTTMNTKPIGLPESVSVPRQSGHLEPGDRRGRQPQGQG